MSIVSTVQPDLRRKKINGQKLLVIFLFAVVPLFLLILFTYIPFAKMIQFSFHNMSYTKDKGIVGFDNYLRIFTKSEYVDAMLLSLYYMAGAVVQLALALLEKRDLRLDAAVRANTGRAVANLPREAVIEAPLTLKAGAEQAENIALPGALADLCLDIDEAGRLAARAASGDREALRECVELDPALGGLDRLYCLDAVNRLIELHSDILSRWGEEEDD